MTVIAYRDGILAADKLTQTGSMKATVTKIYQIGDAMVGVSGTLTLALEMIEWLRAGAAMDRLPDFQKTQEDYQPLMMVRDRKIWVYEQGGTPFHVESPYYAIGSGSRYAMAAMWCGKTAIEAVTCASELDTGCGMGVDWLSDGRPGQPAPMLRLVA